ncbi:MAG TPA: cytidine deaminase [Rhodothermales bacterium]|nr:cytidine deaminase [Rhodothermales bacterium]
MPPPANDTTLAALRAEAQAVKERAYVPYSGRHEAVVVLLSDGTWVPGVRVENASYSLLIPALVNAYSTAVAAGRRDVVAVVGNHPLLPEAEAFLHALPTAFDKVADDAFIATNLEALPIPCDCLDPFLPGMPPDDEVDGIALARDIATRAYVPESDFPVGCVLVTAYGLLPGVNVEHSDWTRILCAERNAIGTAITWGAAPANALYLTCTKDPEGSPCGACRQVLAELATGATLWMDRGSASPEAATPEQLLPGAFTGEALHPASRT